MANGAVCLVSFWTWREDVDRCYTGEAGSGESSPRARCIPRSSNGRTAAFGAVSRGSNPCRGANNFCIENNGPNCELSRCLMIPFGLSVRIHAGVSGRRERTGADDLPELDVFKRRETFWNDR